MNDSFTPWIFHSLSHPEKMPAQSMMRGLVPVPKNSREQAVRLGFFVVLIVAGPYARDVVDGIGDAGLQWDGPRHFDARDFMIEKSKTCSRDIFLSVPIAFSSKSRTLS
jgi:hypothetical protein